MQNDFYSDTPRLGLSVAQVHNPTVHLKTKELSLEVYSDYSILIDKIEQTISNNVFANRVKFNRISDKKIVLYSEHGEYKGIDLAHSFIVQYEEAIKITGKPTQLKWKACYLS